MKKLLLTTLLLITGFSHAQTHFIRGVVLDSTDAPLPFATVAALSPADSTMIGFAISDNKGAFQIEIEEEGKYLVKIVLVGYSPFNDEVVLNTEHPVYDLGKIVMTDNQLLKAFDITAEHIPILINGDTIEYNAEAFQTDPNAPTEEMLGQMPGIEVDEDGNIKAQGKDVGKIFVDGKEFFGDDPKMATKNLPADAVKKVQVYDRKSETSEFTGVDDGDRNKTINIQLKDDKKKGFFGNVTVGYGSEDRFKMKANVNKFNKKTQISFIGMGNNTNENGFSWQDYANFMGGDKSFIGGGNNFAMSALPVGGGLGDGLITTYSAGLNVSHEFSKKLKLSSSYYAYRALKDLDKLVIKNTLLDTITYISEDNSQEMTEQWVHRLNVRLDYRLDSMRELTINASADYRTDDLESGYLYNSENETGEVLNFGDRTQNYSGYGLSSKVNVLFKNKFAKLGRNLVLELNGATDNTDFNGGLENVTGFSSGPGVLYDTLNQNIDDNSANLTYAADLAYTEPLGKNKFFQVSSGYSNEINESVYSVQDYTLEPLYTETFNTILSSDFEKNYSRYYGGSGFRWIKDKVNINAGAKLTWFELSGMDVLQDTNISRKYFAPLPLFTLQYSPRPASNIDLSYRTNLTIPTLTQLQSKIDNSDPVNIVTGNPDLRPSFTHSLNLDGGRYSQFSMSGFYGGVGATYTIDQIQYARTVNAQFIQTTRPINVDNNVALTARGSYYNTMAKLGLRMHLSVNGNLNKGIIYVNGEESNTSGQSVRLRTTFSNINRKKISVEIRGSYGVSLTTYEKNNFSDQSYTSISGSLKVRYKVTDKWSIRSKYNHTQYQTQAFPGSTIIPLLGGSVSRFIMVNNRGELRFEVFDIFNQNKQVSQEVLLNSFQETRRNAIGRYFMFSFTYSLSKMKQPKSAFIIHD